jgi:formate dehydrogenase major subunit/formate dehydrogenase alpha subunit
MDTASALDAAGDGRLRAMLLVGDGVSLENGSYGDGARALGALEALEFLVVADAFMGPAAQRASVVLPRAAFAEKDGTFTNLERRIQRLKPAMGGEGSQARPESWVFCQLAQRMGHPGFGSPVAAETMDEIARVTPIYGGVSYPRLEASGGLVFRTHLDSPQPTQVLYSGREHRGIQWPCLSPEAETTPTLYAGGFPGQKADFETPQFLVVEPPRESQYPALLVPGRVLLQADREFEVVKGQRNRIVREERLELNPGDAAAWGIQDGDMVEASDGGQGVTGRAALLPSIPPGVIGVTSLFGEMILELQDSPHPTPASRLPGLRIRPARIAKIEG